MGGVIIHSLGRYTEYVLLFRLGPIKKRTYLIREATYQCLKSGTVFHRVTRRSYDLYLHGLRDPFRSIIQDLDHLGVWSSEGRLSRR